MADRDTPVKTTRQPLTVTDEHLPVIVEALGDVAERGIGSDDGTAVFLALRASTVLRMLARGRRRLAGQSAHAARWALAAMPVDRAEALFGSRHALVDARVAVGVPAGMTLAAKRSA